jgi:hypothetical protein
MLHHHVLPLPEEGFAERLATRLGWPFAAELALGRALVERVLGRADLILHGHRHVPRALSMPVLRGRTVGIYNAGSSTELGDARVFRHLDGVLVGEPTWISTRPAASEERSTAFRPSGGEEDRDATPAVRAAPRRGWVRAAPARRAARGLDPAYP